ncbi:MAG: hypothetical protein ABI591_20080 [Kofleriaceae bacterium]
MKLRSNLLGLAMAIGLTAAACGDDSPFVPDDGNGSGSGSGAATFTSFVLDLVTNHTTDPTPADYSTFKDLPDPDGDTNNGSAYDSLFH